MLKNPILPGFNPDPCICKAGDDYVITAKDIKGPWSEPVYLHSSGFDAS